MSYLINPFILSPSLLIVSDSLTVHLDAGNTASYPGSGSIWYDLSGNGRNATKTANVGYTTTGGGGLTFDGTNNSTYLDFSVNNLVTGTNPFTIEVFYNNFSNPNGAMITNYGVGYVSNSIWVYPGGIWINNDQGYLTAGTNFTGTHHLTVTRDASGNGTTYFNGSLNRSWTNTSSIVSNINWRIGADVNGGGEPFYGHIYIIRIYSRVLTAQEVLNNFNAQRSRFGI